MTKRALAALPLLLASLASLAAAESDDPRAWLDRMGQAVDGLNYEGVFVHIHAGEAETMRVFHRVDGENVSERLVALNGMGLEIIRNSKEVRCTLARDRAVVVEERRDHSPLRATLPSYSEELDRYYEFLMEGTDRVADRDTRIIHVKPRDHYRYGFKLWLDEETAMPIKSNVISETGDTLEQTMFTSITINAEISDAALAPVLSGEGYTSYRFVNEENPARESGEQHSGWGASRLPDGFKLSAENTEKLVGVETPVEHLVYSDGLASVSVFVEAPQSDDEQVLNGLFEVGSVNGFATMVDGHHVTVVGEVPAGTVELIGNAVYSQANVRRR